MTDQPLKSLTDLAAEHLATARASEHGRSAVTVYGGQEHDLRHTLIALAQGHALGEHDAPGEATLQVLQGRVRLRAGEQEWEVGQGELLVIPQARHDLVALADSVVLLSVATRAGRGH